MGFYLRKSIRVGPLRFNLSKSGIGVSAGIRGFRVGSGPRGNYIHMGVGGLYYRQTLSDGAPGSTPPQRPVQQATRTIPTTHEAFQEIDSASVSSMVDSSSTDLLAELSRKRKKFRLWPLATIAGIASTGSSWYLGAPTWLVVITAVLFGVLIFLAFQADQLRKTVVLCYHLEPQPERAYENLHGAADNLSACAKAWNVEAQARVYDRKYHAGAGQVIKRKSISIRKGLPPYVKSNIAPIAIPAGRETLYFFPDRLLVFAPNGVGAVGYRDLNIEIDHTRFVEDGWVPKDSKVVDQTWQYVNKSGGPDRRFKNNRQLPVCLYEEIWFRSESGLNELVQLSRVGTAEGFKQAVAQLAGAMPAERRRAT